MPLPLLAVGAAAGLAGGLGSYFSNMAAQDRMAAIQDRALKELLAIQIPDPAQQRLALQRFAQTGELTPQFEQAIKAAPSEFNKIVVDQRQKAAQNRALDELSSIGNKGGLRLQDKAALQDAQMQSQIQDKGARAAILDDASRRGQGGGSGMALQAQLQGQQAVGDRNAKSALSVAASAQDRALQSLIGAGDLATKGRGQDFQEQSARASANDAINRFNTQNLMSVNHNNVGIANNAQAQNLGERQRIADANVNTGNKEQQYNKELLQQQYDNQIKMQNAKNGIYGNQSQIEGQKGKTAGDLWTSLGQFGAGTATALAAGGGKKRFPFKGKWESDWEE